MMASTARGCSLPVPVAVEPAGGYLYGLSCVRYPRQIEDSGKQMFPNQSTRG